MAANTVAQSPARVVRGYELREPVRMGAAGTVYRAFQPSVQRPVLVRVIPPELMREPGVAAAFEAEAVRVARLEHPHILPLYDYWQDDTGAYLVARWLPRTLRDALELGPWALDGALRLAEQLGLALDAAHRAGIVHHGVAPDLVLLDEAGNAYLAGFVMSRVMADQANGGTAPGPYAAPEQRAGQPATPQSDLFSLGLLTFEALTGTAPEWAGAELPPVRTFEPGLPAALDAVLQTATARQPERRYADGRRFAAVLRASAAPAAKTQPLVDPLTEREMDILGLMAQGRDNAEIADHLVLSGSTVKWYAKQIYSKLDAHTREEAVDRARGLGLTGAREPGPAAPAAAASPVPQSAHRRGLPSFGLPFIGRKRALADLAALLAEPAHPLITVVAPGGMGKTRLAVEATRAAAVNFPDGVIYVPLTASHEAQFPEAVLQALGILVAAEKPVWEQIVAYCAPRCFLLLLDNFEAVIGAGRLLAELLAAAPRTRALVTSRERLCLEEETVYPLGSMEAPPEGAGPPPMVESMQLFIERARRVRFGFAADAASLTAIADICRLAGGMPLAIVLAASWADVLAPAEIAAEIRASHEFLAAEFAGLPERQRSMRIVFESAWERLTGEEQRTFARLSVFRGGFTRGAASVVAGAPLRTLAGLVTKALIWADESGRYSLHELLRQFAGERLAAAGETEVLQEAHSRYMLEWATRMEAESCGPNPAPAHDAVDADWHNLRAALLWAAGHGRPEWITPTWKLLWDYHVGRARIIAGQALLEEVVAELDKLPDTRERDDALGSMLVIMGEFMVLLHDAVRRDDVLKRAWPLVEKSDLPGLAATWFLSRGGLMPFSEQPDPKYLLEALARFRAEGDRRGEAITLFNLCAVWAHVGGTEQIRAFAEDAAEIEALARETGDLQLHVSAQNVLGIAFFIVGRFSESIAHYLKGAALARTAGTRRSESTCLVNAALSYMRIGALDSAQAGLEAAVAIRREILPFLFISYDELGEVFLRKGEFERARPLFTEGEALFAPLDQPRWTQIYLLHRIRLAFCLGQWDELAALIHEMHEFVREVGETYKLHFALATGGYAALALNDEPAAQAALADLKGITADVHGPISDAFAATIHAELQRRAGDPSGAAAALYATLPILDTAHIEPATAGWENDFGSLHARGYLVRALLDCGAADEARIVALTALERAYAIKAPPFVLGALLACARVQAASGDTERAAETAALIANSPLAFASDRLMAAALVAELPAAPARAVDWEQAAAEWLALAMPE